jgi:D-glycero-alpha-D-manno-heptose-7-phosphate kinase
MDKYCYISCRFRFSLSPETRHRVVWSHIENVSTIAEILHPAVREGLRWMGFTDECGIEIHHQADLRARAGIGSSSAFAVGLINALCALRDERVGAHELALRAIHLEQEILGDTVGCQDQVATAHGGLNVIRFSEDGEIQVEPVAISEERKHELASRLLLIYTGSTRLSSKVTASVVSNLEEQAPALMKMRSMVDDGRTLLESGDLDGFGRLLNEAWTFKRGLGSGVSSEEIDAIYARALAHGALGGKLLGAGGTGFMAFYVPPGRRASVSHALSAWPQVPFRFENEGAVILTDTGR